MVPASFVALAVFEEEERKARIVFLLSLTKLHVALKVWVSTDIVMDVPQPGARERIKLLECWHVRLHSGDQGGIAMSSSLPGERHARPCVPTRQASPILSPSTHHHDHA